MRRIQSLAAVVGLLASFGVAQDSVTIASSPKFTARPVSALLQGLRKQEGLSVTYEDPRYGKRSDMDERPATFVYSRQELHTADGAETIIARMLREYGASGGLTFTVVRDGPRLHVVPSEGLNAAGDRIRQDSILDTVVNIPPRQRNGNQLLHEICDQVKQQTGYRIDIGPGNPGLQDYHTSIGIENQTARTALGQVWDGASSPGSFVWDLYYDPADGGYGLSFAYVGPAGPVKR